MKRMAGWLIEFVVIVLAVTLSIAGCTFLCGLIEPLIGQWEGLLSDTLGNPTNDSIEFKPDKTYTEVTEFLPTAVTTSGTYEVDHAAGMITASVTASSDPSQIPVDSVWAGSYQLSRDKDTLTLSWAGGTGVYQRQ